MYIGRRTIDTLASSNFISIEAKTRGNYRLVSLETTMSTGPRSVVTELRCVQCVL